jgi:hypothetical protein
MDVVSAGGVNDEAWCVTGRVAWEKRVTVTASGET